MKQPILEKIEPGFGSSFKLMNFTSHAACVNPYWHFHPEYEIVFIDRGRGRRHVGNHISFYKNGDLVFLGPNIPHLSFTEDIDQSHEEVVVQMKEDFLGEAWLNKPEFSMIRNLFEKAKQGIIFKGSDKKRLGARLMELQHLDAFGRLMELLYILNEMAIAEDYQLLNAGNFSLEVASQDRARINSIYLYVESNFKQPIQLNDIASEVNMTVPAFCRYFKKLTSKTFTQFVNEYRIAHAIRLLSEEHVSISDVCFESGFNNFSHFNKQFKLITGKSPRDYRKDLKMVVGIT